MLLSAELKTALDKSVLCWLATVSAQGLPNVSPKEVFSYFGTDEIIIANIASPQSVRNIRQHGAVCVSFIDILVQKGYKVQGQATVLGKDQVGFAEREAVLLPLTEGQFPFATIIQVRIERVQPILAPRYQLYPATTEQEQIARARAAYGL